MGEGLKAKPLIVAATVPVSVDASHPAAPPALSDAALLADAAALSEAAADSLGAATLGATVGAVVAVPLLEQAETMSRSAAAAARWNVRDIAISSCLRIRGVPLDTCRRYAGCVPTVS